MNFLSYKNCKYEITNGLVTCEKSYYNSRLINETYFEYNNMKQIVSVKRCYNFNDHYDFYEYLEDKLIGMETYVGKDNLDRNNWTTKLIILLLKNELQLDCCKDICFL